MDISSVKINLLWQTIKYDILRIYVKWSETIVFFIDV